MPSEANTKRAEPSEWAWRQVDRALPVLEPGEELGRGSVAEARLLLALSLDAAEQRGREEVLQRVRELAERERRAMFDADVRPGQAMLAVQFREREAVLRELLTDAPQAREEE